MNLKHTQFIGWRKSLGIICLWAMLLVSARANVQSSVHYLATNESFDGGGVRGYSSDYVADASFNPGDFINSSSANYVQRGGYIGGLNNPPVVLPQTFTRATNAALNILVSNLTGANGATDTEGDIVSLFQFSNVTPNGINLKKVGNVFLVYMPNGYTGSDTVGWTASDSEGDTAPGNIHVVVPTPISGPTLNLISATPGGGANYTLLFAGLPPAVNTLQVVVQSASSLTSPNWQTVGLYTVTNGILSVTVPNYGSAFFRTVYQ